MSSVEEYKVGQNKLQFVTRIQLWSESDLIKRRTMPVPSAEPETKAETLGRPEPPPEPAANYAPNAEPVPAWPAAKHEWEGAWELHWIGFGLAFLLLALWSVLALIRARKTPLLITRRFCYAINFLLILLGITRALALFLYPYEIVDNAGGTPVVLERILFGIGFPCITAGFTLIHFAFLEAAKVSLSSRRIQSLRFIIGVISVHFALVIISEIVTSYVSDISVLVIICMLYFIVSAFAVSASVFISGYRLVTQAKTHRRTMRRISARASAGAGYNSTTPPPYCNKESNTSKVMRVTLVTAFLGITCAALQIYAMAGIFKVRASGIMELPDPWPWWSYQTAFRMIELGLAGTMAYTVSQPKKKHERMFSQICLFGPCAHPKREDNFTDSGLTMSGRYSTSHEMHM